jgi:hypothetical protein
VVAMVDLPPGVSFEPTGLFYYTRSPVRPARMRVHPSWLNGLGFFLMSQRPEWGFIVPHWFFLLPLAALPGFGVTRWARRRHHRPTNQPCPACGYELRATPERCQECGKVPAEKKSAISN